MEENTVKQSGEFPMMEPSLFNQPRETVQSRLACTEEVSCILCRAALMDPLPPKRIFGIDYQGFELAECSRCGFRFLSKRPNRENLIAAIYENYWDDNRESLSDTHRRQEIEMQIRRMEIFRSQSTPPLSHSPRVLDVGCGNGLFLRQAIQHGWQVMGTEIVPAICEKLRQQHELEVFQGFLPEVSFGNRQFDLIRLNQVLEHTFDPLLELQACYRRLAPGGIMLVSVPNAGSLQYFLKDGQSRLHLKKNRFKHYAALHHFWFFTRKSLSKLCQISGFEILHWESRVPQRPSHRSLFSRGYSRILGRLGWASIQDLYIRKQNGSQ